MSISCASVLRFIEDSWGLSQLTHRDEQAGPMLSAFDFDREPAGAPPAAAAHRLRGPDLGLREL